MIEFSGHEAILFRLLVSFFGEDRVIPQMSIVAVCGGSMPESFEPAIRAGIDHELRASGENSLCNWAKRRKCLFTIVNSRDRPCMVIEFAPQFMEIVDLYELQRRRLLEPILFAAGVPYVQIDSDEFFAMTEPGSGVSIFSVLKSKVEDFNSAGEYLG